MSLSSLQRLLQMRLACRAVVVAAVLLLALPARCAVAGEAVALVAAVAAFKRREGAVHEVVAVAVDRCHSVGVQRPTHPPFVATAMLAARSPQCWGRQLHVQLLRPPVLVAAVVAVAAVTTWMFRKHCLAVLAAVATTTCWWPRRARRVAVVLVAKRCRSTNSCCPMTWRRGCFTTSTCLSTT